MISVEIFKKLNLNLDNPRCAYVSHVALHHTTKITEIIVKYSLTYLSAFVNIVKSVFRVADSENYS